MPSHTGVFLQAQVIFLSADAPMAPAPSTQLGGSTLAVHLSDDLAGRARVGERVLISGSGRFLGGAPGLMAPGAHLALTQGILVRVQRSPGYWGSWIWLGSLLPLVRR